MKALLLDLDDTLLTNPMSTFVPAYLQTLTRFLADAVPAETLVAELLRAIAAMERNDGSGPTNAETFAAHFFPAVGVPQEELEPLFARFYAEAFPTLRVLTRPRPEARPLVEWALASGLQVAVATNPVFPRTAIEQRLAWAGLPVHELPFALVTTYEEMRATKSHPAYYLAIAGRLGRGPEECLMAGDDWGWDIEQSLRVGMQAWWVTDSEREAPDPALPLAGRGSLGELHDWLRRRLARSQ